MRVTIQAGHSAEFSPFLPGGGGAPGEAQWTARLAHAIGDRLAARGVQAALVGSWLSYQNGGWVEHPAPADATKPCDAFIALHYDGSTDPNASGCCAARPNYDPMAQESDRLYGIWAKRYPAATGIPLHQERVGIAMRDYYAFRDTPAVPQLIIEHGYGAQGDHAVLFDKIDLVADTDAAVILEFLGIQEPAIPIVAPIEVPEMTTEQQLILDACARHGLASAADVDQLVGRYDLLANQIDSLQWLLGQAQGERDAQINEVARLNAELTKVAQVIPPSVVRVTISYSDGTTAVLPPA